MRGTNPNPRRRQRNSILEIIKEGPFHTKPVTTVSELTTVPVVITAGMDGKIIFWNIEKSTQAYIQSA